MKGMKSGPPMKSMRGTKSGRMKGMKGMRGMTGMKSGRPMKGMVMVSVAGIDADGDLAYWVARGVGFAGSLPAK